MDTLNEHSDNVNQTADQLHRSIMGLLRVIQRGRPDKKLSLSKISILGYLYRNGMATSTTLAAYLHIKPQSLTRLIADLEKNELIKRRRDKEDRRQSLLEITDRGAELIIKEIHDQRLILTEVIVNKLTTTEQELLRLASGLIDQITIMAEKHDESVSADNYENTTEEDENVL